MRKTIIRSDRLGEEYIRLEHESGLCILLYPMKGFRTAYAMFGTDYGSIDNQFRLEGETDFSKVPDGIAHYLEHKLFESEDGDAFTLFARTGADANAFTAFDRTCYLFSCTEQFEESFRALLQFVQSPYFTPETVQKEQGIIGQEIRMYDDNPGWQVLFGLLTALYQNHPIRNDIAGTVESIAQIDADLLYRCYHAFYNPANMVVTVAGNFDPEAAEKILNEEIQNIPPRRVERPVIEEPAAVFRHEVVRKLDVSEPLFYFGWKHQPLTDPAAELRAQVVYNILLDLLAGTTSDFYEDMNRAGLLNQTFGSEVFAGRSYRALFFGGESRDPHQVWDAFCQMLERKKQSGLSEEEFLECRNALYGRALRDINDVETTANALFSYEMMGMSVFDVPEMIASIKLEELQQALQDGFSPESGAISIVMPIQK
ncbi:MAG: EF-P 5-aminopentanol modification-associated protein YfmH [Candidatus Merdivicinus sp.]|jgi:predicted Zn-dependent peptidase